MNVKIISDSGADLPKSLIERYDIDILPLIVIDGEKEYTDGVTINPVDLFAGMRRGTVYKTSQPNYQHVYDVFSRYAEEKRSCLYIAFSSELSGTYQTAVMVKNDLLEEHPDFDLDIIDTKCASFGEGLVIHLIGQLAEAGKSKAELIKAAQFYAENMDHIFTVDDLAYLLRGGRISPVAAFIGGILNIKPILDVEEGKLKALEKVRGRKKVFQRMLELMQDRGVNLDKQTIGISHGDDLEAAEQFAEMLREKYGTKDIIITMIGGAIGAHAGPGTLAVFFLKKELPSNYLA